MSEKTFSNELIEAVRDCLDYEGLSYTFNETSMTFEFNVWIMKRSSVLDIHIKVNENYITVISFFGEEVFDKEEIVPEMLKFVCYANNYSLIEKGCFLFDPESGEVRFRVFIDCDGINVSREVIRNSIYFSAFVFDRYGECVSDIIIGESTAEEAMNSLKAAAGRTIFEMFVLDQDKELGHESCHNSIKMEAEEFSDFIVSMLMNIEKNKQGKKSDEDEKEKENFNMNLFGDGSE